MLLSSLQRMLRYLAGESGKILTDNEANRRDILILLEAISNKIRWYLNRNVESADYTEYFDIGYATKEFWIGSAPVSSITSVKEDPTGRFDGDESTLDSDDYYIGTQENSVVLVTSRAWEANRGLQIIYTGGLAAHAVRSTFVVASTTDWTVGQYCIGASSAVGIVRAVTATSLTIEVLYGIFQVAETITEHANEAGSDAAGATTTITSKSATALCESIYNPIVTACESEMRYWRKHKFDFENDSTERDGFSIRRSANSKASLQPETRALLDPHKIIVL